MTDRQRALLATMVYTVRNRRFFAWHRVGVKRLPDGVNMYQFSGKLLINEIDLNDEKYNRIIDSTYYDNPWTVKYDFIGKRGTDQIKLVLPAESVNFYGYDGDLFRFEGTYYAPADTVDIRDFSQDKDKYVYRIIW